MRSFTVETLGCKVNRYESEAISERLADQGWRPTNTGVKANLCVVNTCAVTRKAAMQSRQVARKIIRSHQDALVVVTGCYAQMAPEVFAYMPGVDKVVENALKDQIPQLAEAPKQYWPGLTVVEDLSAPRPFQDLPITRFGVRTRPFVKIQDGCDAFCAYCIIPYARGRSRSLKPEVAIERIRGLKQDGYREVVLCGIHIGQYGKDLTPVTSLIDLIRAVDVSQGPQRLRLSSIEPMELSEGLIHHIAASERICPHLHIPLQSGDDEVLKAMNRPYRTGFYNDLIRHVVHMIPYVAVGVDVLVGFPGESQRAFENTYRMIEKLPVAYLHVFPFSAQKGTAAESLPNQVSPAIIKKRCHHMRILGEVKRKQFFAKHLGSTRDVLIEGKPDRTSGYLKGFTTNYIPVLVKGYEGLVHRVVQARLDGMEHGKVFGTCVSSL